MAWTVQMVGWFKAAVARASWRTRACSASLTVMWEKFQRDIAVEFGIVGFIHNAHTTFTQFFEDLVVRYGRPNHVASFRESRD